MQLTTKHSYFLLALGFLISTGIYKYILSLYQAEFISVVKNYSPMPPIFILDIIWLALYLCFYLAIILSWKKVTEIKKTKLLIGALLSLALIKLAWMFTINAFRLFDLTILLLISFIAIMITMITQYWRIHRGSAILLIPFCSFVVFLVFVMTMLLIQNPDMSAVHQLTLYI